MTAMHQLGLPELVINRRNSAVSSFYHRDRPDGTVKIRRLPARKPGSPRLHLHRRTLGPWSGAKGRRV
jgi:hypothetical protein